MTTPYVGKAAQHAARSAELVQHEFPHPNVFPASQPWSADQVLHVAVAYSNPRRWRTRRELFNNFRRHIAVLPNIRLYVGELAYGDRPFEVTSAANPLDFQIRTSHELWHKENILNHVIARFDHDWEYGAYVDGDFHFTRNDVGLETIHQLQHYDWVQMFSTYSDLSPNHRPMRVMRSFANRFTTGELTREHLAKTQAGSREYNYGKGTGGGIGTTGGAWAFRRSAFNDCGGLLDTCILGSGDWHMAFGLAGEPDIHPQTRELIDCGQEYAKSIKIWQTRAAAVTRKNIGCVDCHAIHYFHGSKKNRGYDWRWQVLRDNSFNPYTDLHKDWQGIYQLNLAKPNLRDGIRRYFNSRDEDCTALSQTDTLLGA